MPPFLVSAVAVVIVLLSCLLIGYASGRRQGLKAGRAYGRAEAGLSLRAESLRTGTCKICDRHY